MTGGASLNIRVAGERELERALAERAAKFGDLSPLMDVITGVLVTDAEDNFDGQHGPDGKAWAPIQREGKILQDSRRLRMSLAGRHTATTSEVGTNVVYAARHQEGFKGSETVQAHKRVMQSVFGTRLREPIEVAVGGFSRTANTPARPFLGLSAHAEIEIAEHVADYAGAEP